MTLDSQYEEKKRSKQGLNYFNVNLNRAGTKAGFACKNRLATSRKGFYLLPDFHPSRSIKRSGFGPSCGNTFHTSFYQRKIYDDDEKLNVNKVA